MTTIDARRNRYGAVVVLVATAVLVGGLVAHPYVGLGRPDSSATYSVSPIPSHLPVESGDGRSLSCV